MKDSIQGNNIVQYGLWMPRDSAENGCLACLEAKQLLWEDTGINARNCWTRY